MNASITQIHPLVRIRRTRKLEIPGTVLVRVGQKVSPLEVLAESEVPVQHYLIDVFRSLGLKNSAEAEKLIQRQVGDQLEKHDIIAETGGLFSRVIRSPMPGKIVSINNGQVLLETNTKKYSVQSGLSGSVVQLIKDQGAVVETNGMLIQGVWGNNKIGFGQLLVDETSIANELTPESISITARGSVIAAAYCSQIESLTVAENLPVGGIILGSISTSLVDAVEKLPFPVILLEGFGKVQINSIVRQLLLSNAKREVSLIAEKWDRTTGIRPEMVISLPADAEPYREVVDFVTGQCVRDHSAPFAGRIGTIESIPSGLSTLPNGIKTNAALVKFVDGESELVPFSNLDILDLENRFLGKTESGG